MPVYFTTLLGRNAASIERQIPAIAQKFANKHIKPTVLFAFSAGETVTGQPVNWSGCWKAVKSLGSQTLGCFSSPLNNISVKGASGYLACSIAVIDGSEVVPFRSRIRGDEQVQVGRWHSFRPQRDALPWDDSLGTAGDKVSWDDIWKQSTQKNVESVEGLEGVGPGDVQSILYFTDRSYQGLSRSLGHHFPGLPKLGLIAPSTLTTNELPSTLIYGNDVFSEGAIGLAILKSNVSSSIHFDGARAIGLPQGMTVTASNGNIIETLDGQNPTQLLLKALEAAGASKSGAATPSSSAYIPSPMLQFVNDRIFVGVQDASTNATVRVAQISAGDPSRGPISIMADKAPAVGETVQFFLRPDTSPVSLPQTNKKKIQLVTVPEVAEGSVSGGGGDEVVVLDDVFLVASDAGLVAHDVVNPGVENVGLGGPVGACAELSWEA